MREKTFGFGFDYFFDSSRQMATKRIGHKKFWNIVVHWFASWGIAWSVLFLGGQYLPFYLQLFLVICKLVICIAQEPPAGFAYSLGYCLIGYHAVLSENNGTVLLAAIAIPVCFAIQILSHIVFEGIQSLERFTKGEDLLFQFCDMLNEFLMGEFHFSLLLVMRLDLLPVLQWRSDVDLRKIMDKVSIIKHGRKAP
ncbi:uncharacterized protein LOC116290566 [Actinia tenebrosa]|uniref:Uncharacterized protein LOC116290566 n=1 Tax=Actinia tenebrosa TaxID=6105 RepID=A0A6P8HLE5_ACTTE|nr:uncharacterized protein LOC116290566 [Actinia tenebrosa]